MGSEDEVKGPSRGLAVLLTAGPSGHVNSPLPSSRKGHHSTVRWSSIPPILLDLRGSLLLGFPGPSELGAVDQMRCMITANRRASATTAFLIPRCLAIFMAHALSHDHFARRSSMVWAAS